MPRAHKDQGDPFDSVHAAVDLAIRAGGHSFGLWHDRTWHAQVSWRNQVTLNVSGLATNSDAALALAIRMINRGRCRCGQHATVFAETGRRCMWRMTGQRWRPTCSSRRTGPELTVRGVNAKT